MHKEKHLSIIILCILVFTFLPINIFIVETVKADTVTYYYIVYDEGGEEWASVPENMVDGNEFTYAMTGINGDVEWLLANSYGGGGSGTITNVELRCKGYYSGGVNDVYLRPIFNGDTDGSNYAAGLPSSAGWTSYDSIFSDGEAPDPWAWTDIENLGCDVETYGVGGLEQCRVGYVQIRVTYTPTNNPPTTTLDAIPDPATSDDVEPFTGNAQDSDGTIANVEVQIYYDMSGKNAYWDESVPEWTTKVQAWNDADPSDGTFNSNNEDFEYDITDAGHGSGSFTDGVRYYINARAQDDDSDYDPTPATDNFEYDAGGWTNTPPDINPTGNVTPANNSFLFELHPNCQVWVEDDDGNNTVCDIYTSPDGSSWTHRQHYTSAGNRTLSYDYSVDDWNETWYWKVYANDGNDNVSKWFYFTMNGYFPYCALYYNGTQTVGSCIVRDNATIRTALPYDTAPTGLQSSCVELKCGAFWRAYLYGISGLNTTADFKIDTMYSHVWMVDDTDGGEFFSSPASWEYGYYINGYAATGACLEDIMLYSNNSPITVLPSNLDPDSDTFNLTTNYWDVTESLASFSSVDYAVWHVSHPNNAFLVQATDNGVYCISNRSIMSFIILNIPTDIWDGTDDTTDSDSDGLSDHEELTDYYTDPFCQDTDNDGVDDDQEITDGTDPNDFTDFLGTPAPTVSITYAGNLGDLDGPYWRPPDETDRIDNEDPWGEGYYTNDSRQIEDWIYIKCTITNASTVYLDWLDETSWTNGTHEFTNTDGDNWEINTSGEISVITGHNYSFNINATGDGGNTIYEWNKTGIGGEYTRRYVQLDSTPESISYQPFYFYIASYPEGDADTADRMHHDQGVDGYDHDTGYLYTDIPTSTVHERYCDYFVGYWIDESMAISNTDIENIYLHFWWVDGNDDLEAGWTYGERADPSASVDDGIHFDDEDYPYSHITYDGAFSNDVYTMSAFYIDASSPFGATDNNIYTISATINTWDGDDISIVSNRSFTSFILFNVPSNATLNASAESDTDGLSDWVELYVTHTNPFLDDTDNDGADDRAEFYSGSDPNNYTDTDSEFLWIDVTNESWALGNIVMGSVIYTNETTETFIADMDNTTVNTDLKLQITVDGSGWSAATSGNSPTTNVYRLDASIDTWDSSDVQIITASATTISSNIPGYENETFDLRFRAPTATTTGDEQTITVTASLVKH